MASSFSSISTYAPFSFKKITDCPSSKFPCSLRKTGVFCNNVKVVAEKRDNLDHLQRVNPQQPHERKRVAQVAPTGTWDRFPTARSVQPMMDTMERVMEDPLAYSRTWPSLSETARDGYNRGRTPWAIKEQEKDYKMRFDMPGMTKNDVKVWIEENMLVVKAEKVTNNRESQVNENGNTGEEEEWPTKSYGRYSCRIALPENIEFEKIKAEVKDGVLYIAIRKASTISKVIDIDVQ